MSIAKIGTKRTEEAKVKQSKTRKEKEVAVKDYSEKLTNALGLVFANKGQEQDTGAKIIHIASNTSSKIITDYLAKENQKIRQQIKQLEGRKTNEMEDYQEGDSETTLLGGQKDA